MDNGTVITILTTRAVHLKKDLEGHLESRKSLQKELNEKDANIDYCNEAIKQIENVVKLLKETNGV